MRISVALSTHNGARFLRPQLESIAAQRRLPDELVVRDDGSRDDTAAILTAFAEDAPFPVVLDLASSRLGSTSSFERVLERCTGDVIALCDQDDLWHPEKLEVIADAFARHPDVGLVFHDAALIDEDGRRLRPSLWDLVPYDQKSEWMVRRRRSVPRLPRFAAHGCTIAYRAEHQPAVLPLPGVGARSSRSSTTTSGSWPPSARSPRRSR